MNKRNGLGSAEVLARVDKIDTSILLRFRYYNQKQ